MRYRTLTAMERKALESRSCTAEDWDLVQVAEPFDPQRIRNVRFSGSVRIGALAGTIMLEAGLQVPCGLYDSRVHDCSFGADVLVDGVRLLSGYDLEDGVVVRDVALLAMEGESGFGNGTGINVLNEAGGRTLTLYDRLTAQAAYLLVMHRHRPGMVRALERLIEAHVKTRRGSRGAVGRGSRVCHCGILRNVRVGPYAAVEGAQLLEEGTVAGCAEDPSYIGFGVQARHFLILSGSRVEGAVLLESCFVGQGVRLNRQFSAEHSAFFACSEGDHGEVVSVLAGPFTVSHHKSTLLIGGYVCFFNAGSGTNQSNHMYKLGPLHQGIMERGAKTGSSSYLLWPARIGAFSSVMGKHYSNFDASGLPFSNIAEDAGKTVLTPGVNLLNVGCRRDAEKWIARDRRRDPDRLDLITHGLLTPYTVGRIRQGLAILRHLSQSASRERELVMHSGAYLRRLMLKSCARYYEMALDEYLGDRLRARLEPLAPGGTVAQLREALKGRDGEGAEEWRDLCGLIAPASEVERIEADLEDGRIRSLEELAGRFRELAARYQGEEWAWCRKLLQERLGCSVDEASPAQLLAVVQAWKESTLRLNTLVLADAGKEYDERSRIGFGIDSGPEEREMDFREVRGELKGNAYVRQIEEESRRIHEAAARLIGWLQSLAS